MEKTVSKYKEDAIAKFQNFAMTNTLYNNNSPALKDILFTAWNALASQLELNTQLTTNKKDIENMILKLDHTLYVLEKTLIIVYGEKLNSNSNLLLASQLAAIFHDISRFAQLRLYHTFNDAQSISHAAFSIEIIKNENLLANLPQIIQNCVLSAIAVHSGATLAPIEDKDTYLCAKILRDSDKLDILRIFSLYLDNPENSAIVYNFKDSRVLSKEVWDHLQNKTIPPYTIMKSSIDFLLSRMQWVYDFNFKTTCIEVKNSLFLEKLKSKLPSSIPEVEIYYNQTSYDLTQRCK
jgi:hypothetical protein